ncbi:MAG: D-aminoacyl-tRNA deacylase [Acidobacteriota bacterium]
MKVLVQRVSRAQVTVADEVVGSIGRGVVVLLGVERGDDERLAVWYARRLAVLRLFPAADGTPWSRSLVDVGGGALVVSQFTLAARTRKGRRPSFDRAADPPVAESLYERFAAELEQLGVAVARGRFGAMMQVELVNDGPVTFLLDGPSPGDAKEARA